MPYLAEAEKMVCSACGSKRTGKLASGLCITCLSSRLSLGAPPPDGDSQSPVFQLPLGFEYLELLGRGGMGVVYLAFQSGLNRYVALKQLAVSWQDIPKAQHRFLREAKAAAGLRHKGIVQIFETGTHAGIAWYTMEFIEGGDLSQLLSKRGGRLPWREAAQTLVRVSEAIQYAHDASIAHRDLKPSNILLDPDGAPKICDFGLAWVAGHEGMELTASGEILGTPAYLAPEAISGTSRGTDARVSDIYSLGALLFHLVVGNPPFRGAHPMEILGSIANEEAPRLAESIPDNSIPPSLDRICAKCLEKRPEDRYRSARELASALSDCIEKRPGFFPSIHIRGRSRRIAGVAVTVVVMGAMFYVKVFSTNLLNRANSAARDQVPVIAIMPPQTLTNDDPTAVLAGGLQEELVSTLTRISDLPVVATRSVRAANPDAKDFHLIKSILGADAVLNSRIQKWQDKFRISVELVATNDGRVLWSEDYDRLDTNILDLQTDISIQVATHLNARLRPTWKKMAEGISSSVPSAETQFLRARALTNDASASVKDLEQSEDLLSKAVASDPQFALAYAQLSNVDTQMYNWGNDRSEQRLSMALDAAKRAFHLNADLVEAEIALGNYFFRGSKDYVEAKPHFEQALALSPNNPDACEALAFLERRQGDFHAASVHLRKALNLDPLNAVLAYNTADTFLRMKEYDRASEIVTRSLELMPNQVALQKLRGDLFVAWKGDVGPMRKEILSRNPALPTPDLYLMDKIEYLVLSHQVEESLKVLRASTFRELHGQSIYLNRDGYEALLLDFANNGVAAKTAAARALEGLTSELQQRPNDARVLLLAGQMYYILGDLKTGEKFIGRTLAEGDLACVDAFDRGYFLHSFAVALAGAGQDAKAWIVIQELLAGNSQYSEKALALHPLLQPIIKKYRNST